MGLFRFGLGQINIQLGNTNIVKLPPGDLSEVVPPVLFPNTEVKRFSADDTEGEGSCGKYVIARRLFFNLLARNYPPFGGFFVLREIYLKAV
jgi:hypothetical protein